MAEKRLIDARKTVIKLSGRIMPLIQMGANPTQVYNEVLQVVAEAPTVDAVEVVRCKCCLWYEKGKDYEPYCNHPTHGIPYSGDDDFCSYGERRNDG